MTPRMKSSICNVILLRMISEEYIFEIRTLLFPFLFLSERVVLRSMLGVSPRLPLTLQFSASVPWRSGGVCEKRTALLAIFVCTDFHAQRLQSKDEQKTGQRCKIANSLSPAMCWRISANFSLSRGTGDCQMRVNRSAIRFRSSRASTCGTGTFTICSQILSENCSCGTMLNCSTMSSVICGISLVDPLPAFLWNPTQHVHKPSPRKKNPPFAQCVPWSSVALVQTGAL